MSSGSSERRRGKTRDPSIFAVVVAYGQPSLVEASVNSVRRAAEQAEVQVDICVVDNWPTGFFERKLLSVGDHYLARRDNPGFGAACNEAFRFASSKCGETTHFLLLNPDARLAPDFLARAVKYLRGEHEIDRPIGPVICFGDEVLSLSLEHVGIDKPEAFEISDPFFRLMAFGPAGEPLTRAAKFLTAGVSFLAVRADDVNSLTSDVSWRQLPGKAEPFLPLNPHELPLSKDWVVQNAGSFLGPLLDAGDSYTGYLHSAHRRREPYSSSAWCGAGVILPRSYLGLVGLFDERFFLYYEDVELSWRGTSANLPPLILPELQVLHEHSKITQLGSVRRERAIRESRALFGAITVGVMTTLTLILIEGFRFHRHLSLRARLQLTAHALSGVRRLFSYSRRSYDA